MDRNGRRTGLVYNYQRKLTQIMTFDEMLLGAQFEADIGSFKTVSLHNDS